MAAVSDRHSMVYRPHPSQQQPQPQPQAALPNLGLGGPQPPSPPSGRHTGLTPTGGSGITGSINAPPMNMLSGPMRSITVPSYADIPKLQRQQQQQLQQAFANRLVGPLPYALAGPNGTPGRRGSTSNWAGGSPLGLPLARAVYGMTPPAPSVVLGSSVPSTPVPAPAFASASDSATSPRTLMLRMRQQQLGLSSSFSPSSSLSADREPLIKQELAETLQNGELWTMSPEDGLTQDAGTHKDKDRYRERERGGSMHEDDLNSSGVSSRSRGFNSQALNLPLHQPSQQGGQHQGQHLHPRSSSSTIPLHPTTHMSPKSAQAAGGHGKHSTNQETDVIMGEAPASSSTSLDTGLPVRHQERYNGDVTSGVDSQTRTQQDTTSSLRVSSLSGSNRDNNVPQKAQSQYTADVAPMNHLPIDPLTLMSQAHYAAAMKSNPLGSLLPSVSVLPIMSQLAGPGVPAPSASGSTGGAPSLVANYASQALVPVQDLYERAWELTVANVHQQMKAMFDTMQERFSSSLDQTRNIHIQEVIQRDSKHLQLVTEYEGKLKETKERYDERLAEERLEWERKMEYVAVEQKKLDALMREDKLRLARLENEAAKKELVWREEVEKAQRERDEMMRERDGLRELVKKMADTAVAAGENADDAGAAGAGAGAGASGAMKSVVDMAKSFGESAGGLGRASQVCLTSFFFYCNAVPLQSLFIRVFTFRYPLFPRPISPPPHSSLIIISAVY